jgi:basic amino acid/polyamine antiporter, APA family
MSSTSPPSFTSAAAVGSPARPSLTREMTLLGLVATALCAMIGVGINIVPFMLQRSQPGIGAWVPIAFLVAAVPAALAALCYALLSSAMPRAGGSYVYASRALNPFVGFLASFAQWFGLSMGMGVVAYLMVPMLRDTLATAGWANVAPFFDIGYVRVTLALGAIWAFWWINRLGVKSYERTVVLMAGLMIAGPIIMTITGLLHTPADFQQALAERNIPMPPDARLPSFSLAVFLGTAALLFSSFIGFDAVSQAGGEARNATRNLPLAILIAIGSVTLYYVVFTGAVYSAVPWDYIYRVSLVTDTSAPALLAPLMPPWLGVVILLAVTAAILNSIPSVMLANSRVLYAFSADRVFPSALSRIHPRYRTPHHAITATAVMGSISVLVQHQAGDFFLGVGILVMSMLVNFLLMAVAVITFPAVNPGLYRDVGFLRSRRAQVVVAGTAAALLAALLLVRVLDDLRSPDPWYMLGTIPWVLVMACAALIFGWYWRQLRQQGVDPRAEIFSRLPPE